jgi:ABC-type transport system substrate-binding protein/DNA-binding SARP family transcriptional activator
LEVVEHGRAVVVGAPKVRALLAVLVLHRGEVVSTDRLIDALWGERASPTAARTLQVYVSNLRKALGDGLLVTEGRGYVLRAEPGQTDADRFEALVTRGRGALEHGDALTAADVLREALGVWRGPALADFAYEPFAQPEIARLEEARLAALEDRIDADLASGEDARLVSELEALVREHPLRERVRRQLMLALYRSGRQADALQAYRDARRELLDELGLEPGRSLQELERAILAHDPVLEVPGRPAVRGSPATAKSRVRGGALIAAAGALLLAAIAVVAVKLASSGGSTVRVAPNSVAEIDVRSGRVVGAAPVGVRPGPIAFGSGSLWIANLDDQTISRVDPVTLGTLANIPLSAPPMGLAASADGVWVVEPNANPAQSSVSVSRIKPRFNTPDKTVQVPNLLPDYPAALAAQGHSVWVAPLNGLVTRLDANTGSVQGRPVDPNASPSGIAIGEGAVWLTDTDAGNVIRVDQSGLPTPIPVGNGPTAIAAGEGGVWVVDSLNETVVRVDPDTGAVAGTIHVGHAPAGVAVGGGSVWVANSGDGTVTRINPITDKPETITVGGSPQALTVARGRVWVTVDERSIAPTPAGSGGGTLRMVSFKDVPSMDPAGTDSYLSWQLLYATCAGLLNYPDRSGVAGSQLVPEVAQALPTRSPDGRTYTFTIRRGFRFSPPSGQPVTAQTFKDSIERTLSPAMHSYFAGYMADVEGVRRYMAGKASHIAGIVARGDKLTIRLTAPAPDFLSRLALPGFCAVPSDTPAKPNLRPVPSSAGPYYVSSYTPRQEVTLTRNPNYHGDRPHRFAHIQLAFRVPAARAVDEIKSGTADYMTLGYPSYTSTPAIRRLAPNLDSAYGARSAAARRGTRQFFVNPTPEIYFLSLNTHRPLFSDVRLRQAVNYAIDRPKLAALGSPDQLPGPTADHYLPPGTPGYRAVRIYPLHPDLARARRLVASAHARRSTAVLYTAQLEPMPDLAQIVKNDLDAIGIRVRIKTFTDPTRLYKHTTTPGEPFDLSIAGWIADYPDPIQRLNVLFDGTAGVPSFNDPAYERRLAAVARLSGPQRYPAYGALDLDLARNAAPLAAWGNPSVNDFFSARIGCQIFGPYYMDVAALCIRRSQHH